MKASWLDSYPPGVPAEIDLQRCACLNELFAGSFARFGALPAFEHLGTVIRYATLESLSRAFAAYLRNVGLQRGDRVALILPNVLQYPVALIGALRAGLTVVNANPLYTAHELQYQLADSGAKAAVVLEHFAHTLQAALPPGGAVHVITTAAGDLFPAGKRLLLNFAARHMTRSAAPQRIEGAVELRQALRRGARYSFEDATVEGEDIAFLQYTGGTTGRPKGAVLTHANVAANVAQTLAWIDGALREGEETILTALPLYHIFALTSNLLVFMSLGGRNVLVADPRDIRGLIREMKNRRITAMTGVNTLFKLLLEQPELAAVREANAGALKLCVAGGMALERGVAERWQRVMGVPLIEGYGLTEASPNVCVNRFDACEFTGKLGLPLPSTQVAILDETGRKLPCGEAGEICVRGPQVMRGYWNAPEDTAKVFTTEGWLRTGDVGWMDARGYVEFVDRKKDVIVVSGFKAYPTEIEEAALLHPGVKDAGAVGIPDPHSGEVVGLFVVKRDPELTAQAVREHCARWLTSYKRPQRIVFREALPKSPLGKVLHGELRELARTAFASAFSNAPEG